ncbi:hypothetical protein ACFU2J_18210 [Streptomyces sp. NPDC057387]|uniref:hypothetical protein n=1 Tax=Streptomyces sp. NPDC057387 TaxID=3346115 RepID=UPI003635BC2B
MSTFYTETSLIRRAAQRIGSTVVLRLYGGSEITGTLDAHSDGAFTVTETVDVGDPHVWTIRGDAIAAMRDA